MHSCGKCGLFKPDDAFYPYGAGGKPMPPCKACRKAYRPPHVPVTEKPCSVCGETKPVGEFGQTGNTRTGRRSACRVCERAWRPSQIVTPDEKPCCTCKEVKPASAFYRDNRRSDGLYARCKPCHNAVTGPASTRYQRENPEKTRTYRQKAMAKFFSVPGRMAAQIERLNEYNRLNPDVKAVREQRRRARRTTSVNDFTREQWEALKVAYGHCCVYCGKSTKRLTMDHVVPLSKGGEHTARNIVPACNTCNSKKGNRPAPERQIGPHVDSHD